MRLVYCKQCNRLISEDEIDSGEAYISKDGAWCNTCAIGLGFDVAVKAAEPRRRGRASRMRTPPARRSAAGPLIALIGAILIGVGITTFLYVFLSRPGDGAWTRAIR